MEIQAFKPIANRFNRGEAQARNAETIHPLHPTIQSRRRAQACLIWRLEFLWQLGTWNLELCLDFPAIPPFPLHRI